jgi:hypothetical protein
MDNQSENMKFKIAEIVIGLTAVILGLLYLNTDWISMGVLCPIYAVLFAAIPVLRLIEAKKNGSKGFLVFLPTLCYLLIAFVVIAAAVIYFVKY